MQNILLVDGYNMIGAWRELRPLREPHFEDARDRLIERMAEYKAHTGWRVIVVFDAHLVPGTEQLYIQHTVEVIYPRTNPIAYETAYFEPKKEGQDGREDEETRAKLFTADKNKTLLYLQLNCALEPEVFEADAKHDSKYANGGNVYGGCFSSGFVEGDSWVDYS